MYANKGQAWKIPVALGMNFLLGIPAIVPIWLLWYVAANWPLAAVGLTQRSPTENDGMLPALVLLVPIVGLSVSVWWLANRAVARGTRLRGRTYWTVCAVATLLPTALSMVATTLR
ncbi:hypothetical protein [Actinomadura sp. WMMB 499]|uniref:hypothetical protein n=1 Tax=Actinomadura sp. WMMB 499 TaxID=1219491 RepID=UPI001C3FC167|nr:hypothetical protein [Actinomadura sp. WMMB 499]